ncbi:MAG TPA: hypothetical protein VH439_01730 [Gemmatimonadales bacterium]|jgi:hypothetical protein
MGTDRVKAAAAASDPHGRRFACWCYGYPPPLGSILPLFAHLGLADSAMHTKRALATWDGVRQRPLRDIALTTAR